MATDYLAYKFRIYPTDEQKILFQKTFGCCRFIWNQMLSDKMKYYEKEKKMLKCTPAQYKKTYDWLREVDSLALANVQLQLQSAFSKFFKEKKIGFPRFHSKRKSKKSYTTNAVGNNISLVDNYIKLPKAGMVKIRRHRDMIDGKIKSVTVSQSATGQYFASLLVEYESQVLQQNDKSKTIGLDFSMHELYVDSNGQVADYPHFYRRAEKRLAKAQRKLSKMYRKGSKKQSHRYEKQRLKVAKLHEYVSNQRKDYLHKISKTLTDENDYICIEDLNMQSMSQGLHFGKSVHDNGWGMFVNMLRYKSKRKGKHLIVIDKWFPSSQTCHVCGCVYSKTKDLSVRSWTCPDCGTVHDRDINAAINIRTEGLRLA